ncbi:MAG: hypothetical protein H7Y86_14910 [Rhizobacter sp.]|nr:hypothetical protein [Ferruginibacter sp.]
MKYLLSVIVIVLVCSCSDSFINHTLKAEGSGECNEQPVPVKMISNINGERYEFQYCLGEGFDEKNYTVVRSGDSLLVKFPATGGKKFSYKLILDIDAKPPYRFITLGEGGQTIPLVPSERL